MVENYSQKIDHRTLKPGIYLRASHSGVFTWDFRLVRPNDPERRIPGPVMHSIEHLLAQYLRPVLGDDYIGVFPMGCGTGITILTRDNTHMYNNFQSLLLRTVVNIINDANSVPFSTEIECGACRYHSLDGAKRVLLSFGAYVLRNFLFITPMECEKNALVNALQNFFSVPCLNKYVVESGIGKANVAYSFGKNYNFQKYVVLIGFAGTCNASLNQGDIIFPYKSLYDDVTDNYGILTSLTESNELLGKDDYIISTNDSFADKSFIEKLGLTKDSKFIFDMEANALASVIKNNFAQNGFESNKPQLIVSRMISDSVLSESQSEDFETFKNNRDFSSMLIGCLQLTEYFTRI